jgi:sulfopropanediol 3-dehydrogenase
MAIEYLKKADPPVQAIDTATADTVRRMLSDIQAGGEDVVRRYARELDGYVR